MLALICCFIKKQSLLVLAFQKAKNLSTDNSKELLDQEGNRSQIAELKESIDYLSKQLEQERQTQQQFISDISHELRNPIAVLSGHISMLQRWGKEEPAILEKSLNIMSQEMQRMAIMVNETLDTVRLQGTVEGHEDEMTDLGESVEKILANFRLLKEDFTFNFDSNIKPITGKIYALHFEQALIILLDNAVKYSGNSKKIEVDLNVQEDFACLSVIDYGQGMSEQDLDHIFDRFYRSETSKMQVSTQEGAGIGLAILKQIANAYHLSIQADSRLGVGLHFI